MTKLKKSEQFTEEREREIKQVADSPLELVFEYQFCVSFQFKVIIDSGCRLLNQ